MRTLDQLRIVHLQAHILYNLTASFRAMASFASARHFRWANR